MVISIADLVQLAPVPAITGIRLFTILVTNWIAAFLSSKDIVADSPVVPQTIMLSAPFAIWVSISFSNSVKLIPSLVNGVIIAVPQPLKIIFFIK